VRSSCSGSSLANLSGHGDHRHELRGRRLQHLKAMVDEDPAGRKTSGAMGPIYGLALELPFFDDDPLTPMKTSAANEREANDEDRPLPAGFPHRHTVATVGGTFAASRFPS
jgi:hypothetical protein